MLRNLYHLLDTLYVLVFTYKNQCHSNVFRHLDRRIRANTLHLSKIDSLVIDHLV